MVAYAVSVFSGRFLSFDAGVYVIIEGAASHHAAEQDNEDENDEACYEVGDETLVVLDRLVVILFV